MEKIFYLITSLIFIMLFYWAIKDVIEATKDSKDYLRIYDLQREVLHCEKAVINDVEYKIIDILPLDIVYTDKGNFSITFFDYFIDKRGKRIYQDLEKQKSYEKGVSSVLIKK